MRKWEEIFKDKLDEYESTLPEGSLSEFHARREGFPIRSGIKGTGVRRGTVAAVAAGLAAVLLLRHPAAGTLCIGGFRENLRSGVTSGRGGSLRSGVTSH